MGEAKSGGDVVGGTLLERDWALVREGQDKGKTSTVGD